jgi:hypothetical protein
MFKDFGCWILDHTARRIRPLANYRLKTFLLTIIMLSNVSLLKAGDVSENQYGSFKITEEIILPGNPVTIYDAITGDISGWWDHSFSESPLHFYIDAKPGGGFYEIFDEEGNGVLHATVIVADRGKLLRFDGPLGLSGRAIKMVHTYEFKSVGSDSTQLNLTVNLAGEIDEPLAKTVNRVWKHFLFERFKPYIEEKKHVLILFEKDQKWGYQNISGRVLIDAEYHVANDFNQYGIASVVDEEGWVYINKNGKQMLRPYIVDNGPDYFSEGMARYVSDDKIGFMNAYGVSVIKATYDFALPFSEGLAAFCMGCKKILQGEYHLHEGGKWGYINKSGEVVIKPEYESAGSFQDGKAEVLLEGRKIVLRKADVVE